MTPQEIFDTAFIGMIKQGEQSKDNGKCKYRSAGGKKCAAGFLIPDDLYDPEMDSEYACSITYVAGRFNFANKLPHLAANPQLVAELQSIHDSYNSTRNWLPFVPYLKEKALELAVRHELNANAVIAA